MPSSNSFQLLLDVNKSTESTVPFITSVESRFYRYGDQIRRKNFVFRSVSCRASGCCFNWITAMPGASKLFLLVYPSDILCTFLWLLFPLSITDMASYAEKLKSLFSSKNFPSELSYFVYGG